MIRGVDVDKRDPRDYRDYENKGFPDREPEWLWSYGGTSDIEVISCRIEGKAAKHLQALDGGAFYSDAPLVNGAKAGQGHRFFGCNFRTNTRFMVKLGSSNRDSFVSCYFEGGYASPPGNGQSKEVPSELKNDPERTGQTRFIDCRFVTVDVGKFWDYKNTCSWPDDTAKKSH